VWIEAITIHFWIKIPSKYLRGIFKERKTEKHAKSIYEPTRETCIEESLGTRELALNFTSNGMT
jgi:hypothetical protein